MASSPSSSNPPPWLETVYLLLMCLWKQEIHKLMICIFYFALFYFIWSNDTGLLWRHLLCNDGSTCTVNCWETTTRLLDTLLMEGDVCRNQKRSCVLRVRWWVEGRRACIYISVLLCIILYTVETVRSRDEFLGSRDEAVSEIRRTAVQ